MNIQQNQDISYLANEQTNLLERLLVASDRRLDVWKNYRPRVFVAALFSLLIAISVFNLGYLIFGNQFHLYHTLAVVTALLLLSSIYCFYRLGGHFNAAVKAFMMVNVAILFGFIVITGGFQSPIIALILFLPFLGFLLEDHKVAIVWTVLGIAGYMTFFLLQQMGLLLPQILASEYLAIAQIFGWVLLCLGLVSSLYIYGRANESVAVELTERTVGFAKKAESCAKSGLLNIDGFERILTQSLTLDKEQTTGLMLVKLLNIKEVSGLLDRDTNKSFYEKLGNECFRVSQNRCEIALLSDTEVAFVFDNMQSTSALYNIGRSLYSSLKRGLRVNGDVTKLDVRCGIAISPRDGQTSRELLNSCEQAVNQSDGANACQIKK